MADKKTSQLTVATIPTDDDYFIMLNAPGGSAETQRVLATLCRDYFLAGYNYSQLQGKPTTVATLGVTNLVGITVGTTPPASPNVGDLWVDTT